MIAPVAVRRIFDSTPPGAARQVSRLTSKSLPVQGLDWNVSTRGLYRAPALVPLSRDHHEALVQALWLRRRAGSPPAASAFLDFFRAELEGHMADEEDVVLPASEGFDPAGAARIRDEHRTLRRLAASLATGAAVAEDMEALARLLHDHVRYEERVFFMGVQAALSAEALADMAAALEAHRAARGVAPGCRIGAR
jgi:hypothetical protein